MKALLPQAPHPNKLQSLHKPLQHTPTIPIRAAELEINHPIINQHPHQLRARDPLELLIIAETRHPLDVGARGERHAPSRAVSAVAGREGHRARERGRAVVQAKRGEDGRHVVVVAEIRIQSPSQREGARVRVEGRIGAGVVLDEGVGEAGEELVGEADALGGAEWGAGAV